MLSENQGQKVKLDQEKKTLSDIRAEVIKKHPEFHMHVYDSFVYIDEIKKSDEVFLFQTKLEL